jgi:hypothetical protein
VVCFSPKKQQQIQEKAVAKTGVTSPSRYRKGDDILVNDKAVIQDTVASNEYVQKRRK